MGAGVTQIQIDRLLAFQGSATALGGGGGSSLICAGLIGQPEFNNQEVVITGGPLIGQTRIINGSTLGGTIIPDVNFDIQIPIGTNFVITAEKTSLALLQSIIGVNPTGLQIKPKTIDLNQIAGTYDLFTATAQDIFVKNLSFRVPTGAVGGAVTSISIQTNDATPYVLIPGGVLPALGNVANLTSEACLGWPSFGEGFLLKVGKKIQLTINGGAAGVAKVCDVICEYEAVVAGGYLA